MKNTKIIIVANKNTDRDNLVEILSKLGYEVKTIFDHGEDAINAIESLDGDLILLDVVLGQGIDGVSVAEKICQKNEIPIIFLSDRYDDETFARAKRTFPIAFLEKPLDEHELYKAIEIAVAGYELKKKIKESEEDVNLILQNVTEKLILWEVQKDHSILCVKCNLTTGDNFGAEEACSSGRYFSDTHCFNKEFFDQRRMDEVIQSRSPVKYELSVGESSQKKYYIVQISPIVEPNKEITHLLTVIRDITEKKISEQEKMILEEQLRQSQKLEAIGSLASGMAHEINNPLMGVINYSQLIRDKMEKDSKLWKYASSIMEEGDRISAIVQNLLTFARTKDDEKKAENVKDVVNYALKLTSQLFTREKILFNVKIPDNLPKVVCKIQEIYQVLLSLLNNARFALNKKYPEVHSNKILQIEAVSINENTNKPMVRIIVEDHGIGIKKENLEKIFDPFFTTRPRSECAGLGLSVSYGIVKDHKGRLSVESEEGEFTRFYLDIPTFFAHDEAHVI